MNDLFQKVLLKNFLVEENSLSLNLLKLSNQFSFYKISFKLNLMLCKMGITNVQLHGEEDSNDSVEERRAAHRSCIEEGIAIHQVTACFSFLI